MIKQQHLIILHKMNVQLVPFRIVFNRELTSVKEFHSKCILKPLYTHFIISVIEEIIKK